MTAFTPLSARFNHPREDRKQVKTDNTKSDAPESPKFARDVPALRLTKAASAIDPESRNVQDLRHRRPYALALAKDGCGVDVLDRNYVIIRRAEFPPDVKARCPIWLYDDHTAPRSSTGKHRDAYEAKLHELAELETTPTEWLTA